MNLKAVGVSEKVISEQRLEENKKSEPRGYVGEEHSRRENNQKP